MALFGELASTLFDVLESVEESKPFTYFSESGAVGIPFQGWKSGKKSEDEDGNEGEGLKIISPTTAFSGLPSSQGYIVDADGLTYQINAVENDHVNGKYVWRLRG